MRLRRIALVLLTGCSADPATPTSPVEAAPSNHEEDAGEPPAPGKTDAGNSRPDAQPPPVVANWTEKDNLVDEGFLPNAIFGDARHPGRLLLLSSGSLGPPVALWESGQLRIGLPREGSFAAQVQAVGFDGTGRAVAVGSLVNASTQTILSIAPGALAWKRIDLSSEQPPGVSSWPAFVYVNPGPGGHVLLGRPGQYLKDIGASLDDSILDLATAPTLPTPPAAKWLKWSSADATLFAGESLSIARCQPASEYTCEAPVAIPNGSGHPDVLVTTPVDANAVFVLSDQLHASSDGGKTFVARPLPAAPITTTRTIAVSTVNPSTLVFFNGSARHVSTDSGATWSPLLFPTGTCVPPTFDGAGTLYTVCAGKLYSATL